MSETRATIRKGDRGEDVEYCQSTLNRIGFDVGAVDGIFGSKTDAGVRDFQASRHIDVDGIVGPVTWGELEAAIEHPPEPPPCDDKFTLSFYTHKSGSSILSSGAEWLAAAQDLGFARIYIQTNSQKEGHTLSKMGNGSACSRVSKLKSVCDYVRQYGLEPCIMPWAPRGSQIAETFDGYDDMPSLPAIMDECGITRCDWDEEGANLLSEEDADEMSLRLSQYPQYEWSWDTHAARFSTSMHMLLEESVKIAVCQAYHSYDEDEPERWWGQPHGPGNRQDYALGRIDKVDAYRSQAFERRSLILALWWQHKSDAVPESGYADNPGEDSIFEGVKVAWHAGIRDLRFWRDEHVAFNWTRKAIEKMREQGWV
jgi:hypothetical protein